MSGSVSRLRRRDQQRGEAASPGLEPSFSRECIHRLTERVRRAPELNQSRVDELRQQLAEGRYRVDPEKLADCLIEHMLDRR